MPSACPPNLLITEKRGQKISKEIEAEIANLKASLSNPRCAAWEALIRLWWSQWDAAHELVQAHEGNPDCDLVHALLHRCEGDFGNSLYWFAQAGESETFLPIATRVAGLLDGREDFRKLLIPGGKWRPQAMVQLVRQFPQEPLLMQIQAQEFIAIAQQWLQ